MAAQFDLLLVFVLRLLCVGFATFFDPAGVDQAKPFL